MSDAFEIKGFYYSFLTPTKASNYGMSHRLNRSLVILPYTFVLIGLSRQISMSCFWASDPD